MPDLIGILGQHQALDLAEVDDEIIDALLIKFDALLGKGDMEEAAKVVAKIE